MERFNLWENFENGRRNGDSHEKELKVERDNQHTKQQHTVKKIKLLVPLVSQAVVISGTVTE